MKLKQLSKARKVNAILFTVLDLFLIIYVCIEWHNQGCEIYSLIAAICVHGGGWAVIGFCADQAIKDFQKDNALKSNKYEYR